MKHNFLAREHVLVAKVKNIKEKKASEDSMFESFCWWNTLNIKFKSLKMKTTEISFYCKKACFSSKSKTYKEKRKASEDSIFKSFCWRNTLNIKLESVKMKTNEISFLCKKACFSSETS